MSLDRRTVLALLGAGAASADLQAFQHHAAQIRTAPQQYRLQFFSEDENRLIDHVAEVILPADKRSPGAHAARVSLYIDLVVANSPREKQQEWRRSLEAFQSAGGRPFLQLTPRQQIALLDRLAAHEKQPREPAERFFTLMKAATLFGYYTSEIGVREELQDKGPEVLGEFPGACKHGPGAHS